MDSQPWYSGLWAQIGIMVAAFIGILGRIFLQRDKIKQAIVEDMREDIDKVRKDIGRLEVHMGRMEAKLNYHQKALEDHNDRATQSNLETHGLIRQLLAQGLQRASVD